MHCGERCLSRCLFEDSDLNCSATGSLRLLFFNLFLYMFAFGSVLGGGEEGVHVRVRACVRGCVLFLSVACCMFLHYRKVSWSQKL